MNTGYPTDSTRDCISFHHTHERYYGFTNYSPHAVIYNGKSYPTSEHLFQSLKFPHQPNIAEHIRTCAPRPSKVRSESHRFNSEVRSDWETVKLVMMEIVLSHKFSQHEDLKKELLGTGNAMLVNDSDHPYWGIGSDRKGHNELGKALEKLRSNLKNRVRFL